MTTPLYNPTPPATDDPKLRCETCGKSFRKLVSCRCLRMVCRQCWGTKHLSHQTRAPEEITSEVGEVADTDPTDNFLALVAGLDQAYIALREARTDLERLQIRDQARAAQAAAEVLKRRDIQVEASVLVAAAERAIAAAHPPQPAGRPVDADKSVIGDHEVPEDTQKGEEESVIADHRFLEDTEETAEEAGTGGHEVDPELTQANIRQMRQAHSGLTDEQFQSIVQKARENGEPLTRAFLKRGARKLNPPEPSDEPKPPSRAQVLEAERNEAIAKQSDLRIEIEELKERVAFLAGESEPVEAVREERFNAYREEIRVLRISVQDWQKKYHDLQGLTRRLTPRCSNGHQAQAMYWRSAYNAFLCNRCDSQVGWLDNLDRLLQAAGPAAPASTAAQATGEECEYAPASGDGYSEEAPDSDWPVEDTAGPDGEDYEEDDSVPPMDAWEASRWLDGFRVGEYVVVDDG